MTLKQLTERDCREWKLSAINPHDRDSWRSDVRSAMCTASKGPTDVDIAPVPCMLIKKSDYDDGDDDDELMYIYHSYIVLSMIQGRRPPGDKDHEETEGEEKKPSNSPETTRDSQKQQQKTQKVSNICSSLAKNCLPIDC